MLSALVAIGLLCLVPRACRWIQDYATRWRPPGPEPPQPYDEAYLATMERIARRNGELEAYRDAGLH